MKTVTCGRCGYQDDRREINGVLPDLPGAWAAMALLVKPVVHKLLCPTCARLMLDTLKHPELDKFRVTTPEQVLPALNLEPFEIIDIPDISGQAILSKPAPRKRAAAKRVESPA